MKFAILRIVGALDNASQISDNADADKYTDDLSVHKYMKLITWQRVAWMARNLLLKQQRVIHGLKVLESYAWTADFRFGK